MMRVLATIVVAGYAIFLLWGLWKRWGLNRAANARSKSAGHMYAQWGSVSGRGRPPRIGISVFALLVICGVLLWAFWWHK